MKTAPFSLLIVAFISLTLPGCQKIEGEQKQEQHHGEHKILVTSPIVNGGEKSWRWAVEKCGALEWRIGC
jgi:hypothetical protein